MSKKRNRSINWEEDEKQLFRSVLKEYSAIIENKSLDTNTNKIKNKAGEEVYKKFNELNGRPREINQLKLQWKSMKIHARKMCGIFKKEINKTGGGARPPTPTDAVIEIRDLLNPAELLIDRNIYDSDGIILDSKANEDALESTSGTCAITLQDSKPLTNTVKIFNIETVEDFDKQVDVQILTAQEVCQDTIMTTPVKKNTAPASTKNSNKKRKITEAGLKSGKDHNDYATSIIKHSKMLKEEEHEQRINMAKEEHSIKMEIHKEKLKTAILERQIFEIKLRDMSS